MHWVVHNMGTAIKHPEAYRVKPSFVIFDIRALWRSECPDVKNYKRRLNPVGHRMLYSSCTHGNSGRQRVNNVTLNISETVRDRSLIGSKGPPIGNDIMEYYYGHVTDDVKWPGTPKVLWGSTVLVYLIRSAILATAWLLVNKWACAGVALKRHPWRGLPVPLCVEWIEY